MKETSSSRGTAVDPPTPHVVFYDGVCALCNGAVRFVIARDRNRRFRFASLQSEVAASLLAPAGIRAGELAALVLLVDRGGAETVLQGPRAVLRIVDELGGGWRLLRPLGWLPSFVLEAIYGLVARTRYRVFGRYDSCPLPDPRTRDLFLDAPGSPSEAGDR